MSDIPAGRRRYPRIPVHLTARLSVLIQEETFQPHPHDALICDIGDRGAMVKVLLSEYTRSMMLKQTRYCRIELNEPGLPSRIGGLAVWIQPEGSGAEMVYRIGLYFSDLPDETLNEIREYISERAQDQANPTAP